MSAEQWDRARVAEYLGVAPNTVGSYASRGQMPPPDGHIGRSPWWWSSTITAWERPGQGRRGTWHEPADEAKS